VNGDVVYYHFPVNAGYFLRNALIWNTANKENVKVSNGKKMVVTENSTSLLLQPTNLKFY
jgi:hypothetical protein